MHKGSGRDWLGNGTGTKRKRIGVEMRGVCPSGQVDVLDWVTGDPKLILFQVGRPLFLDFSAWLGYVVLDAMFVPGPCKAGGTSSLLDSTAVNFHFWVPAEVGNHTQLSPAPLLLRSLRPGSRHWFSWVGIYCWLENASAVLYLAEASSSPASWLWLWMVQTRCVSGRRFIFLRAFHSNCRKYKMSLPFHSEKMPNVWSME